LGVAKSNLLPRFSGKEGEEPKRKRRDGGMNLKVSPTILRKP